MKKSKLLSFPVLAAMFATALFFHYLNSKPENIMNHVILAVRNYGMARAEGKDAAKVAATNKLDENVARLKQHLAELASSPAEAERVVAVIVDRLLRERRSTLQLAADHSPENLKERLEYVNATMELLDSLIDEFSKRLPPDKLSAVNAELKKPQPPLELPPHTQGTEPSDRH